MRVRPRPNMGISIINDKVPVLIESGKKEEIHACLAIQISNRPMVASSLRSPLLLVTLVTSILVIAKNYPLLEMRSIILI